jgi:hypothetical protein
LTYFDAVLDKDMEVLFNGTPEHTREWLRANDTALTDRVYDGRTLTPMTVQEYLEKK